VEEEKKRRLEVEKQLQALQSEKLAAAKQNDGNSKRSHELEIECATLRGELEALSMSKDSAEEERKRRKEVEQQLLALQAEKQAATQAALKLTENGNKRSAQYEAECAALRAELEALSKNQKNSSTQGRHSHQSVLPIFPRSSDIIYTTLSFTL
jgi:ribosomal protein L32